MTETESTQQPNEPRRRTDEPPPEQLYQMYLAFQRRFREWVTTLCPIPDPMLEERLAKTFSKSQDEFIKFLDRLGPDREEFVRRLRIGFDAFHEEVRASARTSGMTSDVARRVARHLREDTEQGWQLPGGDAPPGRGR